MSAAGVREQLNRFESLSNSLGASAMSRVGAGLTADAIRDIEVRAGITLSDEAREVWRWHNGADIVPSPSFWGSGYWFPDLETAIRLGRRDLDIRNSGDVNTYPGSIWVTLGAGSTSSVLDVTDPSHGQTLVYVNDPTSAIDEYPLVTLAERIGWWCWAIENDVHRVTPLGEWQWNFAKVPTGPERNLM